MPLHVSSTCAYRQEVKIVLYSLWYHNTETRERSKITKITKSTKMQFYKFEEFYYYVFVLIELYCGRPVHGTATYRCDVTRDCIVQFWPPDDEHLCSKHVET